MPLTSSACYELLTRHYAERFDQLCTQLREDMRAHLLHTEGVVSVCLEILSALPPRSRLLVDPELLNDAAILHDVAKFDDKDDHHKRAESVILKNRALWGEDVDDKDIEALGSIIRAHKGKFKPDEDYACEAAILRMADKIDMLRRGKDKKNKYEEGIDKIQTYFRKHFEDDSEEAQFLSDFLKAVRALPDCGTNDV